MDAGFDLWARRRRRFAVGAVAVTLALGAAACGDDDDSSSGNSSSGSSATKDTGGNVVAEAESFIKENAPGANKLPTEAPAPAKSLNVWVIPCASAASGCQDVVTGVKAAGKELGWKVTAFDGRGDPARWAAGVDQARVAGADAIVTGSIDCAPIKQSLQKAKSAGVITINVAGFDCEGSKQFTHTVMPGEGETDWFSLAKRSGGVQAAWTVADSKGKANVIQFTNKEQALTVNMGAGFAENLAKLCSTCKIVEKQPFLLADLGEPLTQKANSALLKAPEANYAMAPYDPAAAPVAQAVNSAGKTNSVKVTGAIGAPYSVELIRADRGQWMSAGWDVVWLGWAAMDDIVRLKDKADPVYSGWALGVVDKANLPDSGNQYHGPADYEANYKKIWAAGAAS